MKKIIKWQDNSGWGYDPYIRRYLDNKKNIEQRKDIDDENQKKLKNDNIKDFLEETKRISKDSYWKPYNYLSMAAEIGCLDLAKHMLESVPPNSSSRNGFSHLQTAAYYGHAEIVELLLKAGAEHDVYRTHEPYKKLRPIDLATQQGHTDVVSMLLDHGAEFKFEDRKDILPPLHQACTLGYMEIVKLLLERGADLNSKSVHSAVEIRRDDGLLEYNPDHGYHVPDGESALDLIIENDHLDEFLKLRESSDSICQLLQDEMIIKNIFNKLMAQYQDYIEPEIEELKEKKLDQDYLTVKTFKKYELLYIHKLNHALRHFKKSAEQLFAISNKLNPKIIEDIEKLEKLSRDIPKESNFKIVDYVEKSEKQLCSVFEKLNPKIAKMIGFSLARPKFLDPLTDPNILSNLASYLTPKDILAVSAVSHPQKLPNLTQDPAEGDVSTKRLKFTGDLFQLPSEEIPHLVVSGECADHPAS